MGYCDGRSGGLPGAEIPGNGSRASTRTAGVSHPIPGENARIWKYTGSAPRCAVRIGQLPARPRNTTTARPSLTMSWSARRPIRSPSLERGTVVTLSTIKMLASRRPL